MGHDLPASSPPYRFRSASETGQNSLRNAPFVKSGFAAPDGPASTPVRASKIRTVPFDE